MIARKLDPRRDGKSSFKTLKEYLVDRLRADDWGAGTQTHLNDNGSTFLITESGVPVEHNGFDLDTLVQEFESVIAMKPDVEDPIYHMMISWREGDDPSDEQMMHCAREAIKVLGFDGHQYLNAIHRDTDNPHVHLAINRVHPDTYSVVNPYNDYYKLGVLMSELETKYGFQVDNQGGGRASPSTDVDTHGDLSFLRWCKKHVAPIINEVRKGDSPSWDELVNRLSSVDVEVVERGGGIVFRSIDDNGASVAVKASSVSPQFSKSKLEAVLGAYSTSLPGGDSHSLAFDSPDQFKEWAKEVLPPQLKKWSSRKRADWHSLHAVMEKNGCSLIQYGQGLAIIPKGDRAIQVAASKVYRGLSLANLEKKLGQFIPSDIPESAYAKARNQVSRRRTVENVSDLRKKYRDYRASRPTPDKLRRQLARRIRKIRHDTRQEIKEVYDSMPPSAVRAAYIHELRWQQTRKIQGERLRLIQQYNAEQAMNPTLEWREWLEQQAVLGDVSAMDQVASWHDTRHRHRAGSNSIGPMTDIGGGIELAPGAEVLLGWVRRRRRNGVMDYYTQSGDHVLTQQRIGLTLHRLDDASVLAATQMAIDTYGRDLRLRGSNEFKRRAIEAMVKLEAQGGVRVRLSDPDLQRQLEEQRRQQRKAPGHRGG